MEAVRFHPVASANFRWVRHHLGEWQVFEPAIDWEHADYEAAKEGLGAFRSGPVPTDKIYLAASPYDKEVMSCEGDLYVKVASLRPTPIWTLPGEIRFSPGR